MNRMNGFRKEMNLYYMFLNLEFWNTLVKKNVYHTVYLALISWVGGRGHFYQR